MTFKKQCVDRFNIPLEGYGWVYLPHYKVARKAASALIRCSSMIPADRQKELKDTVLKFWDEYGPEINAKDLERDDAKKDNWNLILDKCSILMDHFKGPDFIEHANSAIQQLTKTVILDDKGQETWPDLESFIKEWRQHFLDHVDPKFLSELWTVDGEIYSR